MKLFLIPVFLATVMMAVVCQVCEETLKKVSSCPSNHEEYQMVSQKCSMACRTPESDTSYQYHCVRTADKKQLIEVCAVSQHFFDYCPMYDLIGKIIQMDESTNCSAKSGQSVYKSSDIFHCDMKCFQLKQYNDVNIAVMIPVNNTKMTPDESKEMPIIPEIIVIGCIVVVIVLGVVAAVFYFKWKLNHNLRGPRKQQPPIAEELADFIMSTHE